MQRSYISPFEAREAVKEHHIEYGVEEEKKRNEIWFQGEQRRLEDNRRSYREELDHQLMEKQLRKDRDAETRNRFNSSYRQVALEPN